MHFFPKLYVWKSTFINMDIATVIIIIEKMQLNLKYFSLSFCLNSVTPCDITEYCIVGLKTVCSNIKFFIFQLICILA